MSMQGRADHQQYFIFRPIIKERSALQQAKQPFGQQICEGVTCEGPGISRNVTMFWIATMFVHQSMCTRTTVS